MKSRREGVNILTCKVGNGVINCFDGKYDKYRLKKWSDENRLICPDCGKLYEYCHGEVITPYFRHKEKSKECDGIYSEPETEEHIKGKMILYNWLLDFKNKGVISDVKLEAYIPETRQRPDLFFIADNKKYVIEYQCSPIATEYLERHRLYELAGIKDIWILGTDKYIEKSEGEKSFREKEIEKHTVFYLDSEYKIFIFNNIDKLGIEKSYEIKSTYSCWRKSNYNSKYDYFDKNQRSLFFSTLLCFDDNSNKYMISINEVEFNNGDILITQEAINNIKEYSQKVQEEKLKLQQINDDCKLFLDKIFLDFKNKYNVIINPMSFEYGFKCDKHYYRLGNIEEYPILGFYEIKYISNSPIENLIFEIDIKNDNTDKIVEYLEIDLKNIIEFQIKFDNMTKEFEERKNREFINLKQELSKFNNKPLYLLFLEDNQIIDKKIRFKVIHDYPNDINDIAKVILKNLQFIESKGAKEYVLMIPKKRFKKSSSVFYSYYKVRNYKSDVKSEFNKLGLNFLEYEDLRRNAFGETSN